jgi:ATP-dependent helicase HepA
MDNSTTPMNSITLATTLPAGFKVWVRHGRYRILAEVLNYRPNGTVEVCWYPGPTNDPPRAVVMPLEVEPARLYSQQRVFLPPGTHWQYGRLVEATGNPAGGRLRSGFIALPDGKRVTLPEDQFHVQCEAFPPHPLDTLEGLGHETPFFWEHRGRFVRELIRQRAAFGGLIGFLAGRIEIFPHQVDVVRRVLQDPRQRYLLADEVGLGKTIESGAVIRQFLLDHTGGRVVVLAPGHLVAQWQAELRERFDLDAGEGGQVTVLPHGAALALGPPPDLVVLDEAHHLLRGAAELRCQAARLARESPRLLLLSATPVLGQERELLTLLAWLEPGLYSPADEPSFRRRIERRGAIGNELMLLQPGMPVFRLRGVAGRLRDLFGGGPDRFDDPQVVAWSDELLQLAGATERDQGAIDRVIVELRLHVSECYRLHRRFIRHRRRGLMTPLARRSVARDEGELTPDQLQAIWEAFDRWRGHLADVAPDLPPETQDRLVAIFAELVQAVGCWSAWAARLVRARLGDASPGDEADAVRLAPLLPGEEPLLRELLRLLVEVGPDDDRIGLLVALFVQESRRLPRLPKTVVFVRPLVVAEAIADRIRQKMFLQVALVRAGMGPEEVAAEVERFRTRPAVTLLVCDAVGSEGLNLQFADRLVHFDQPLNPFVIEQRIGRLDRLMRTTPQAPSILLRSKLAAGAYDDAWCAVLRDGFGVFTGSISDLGLFAEQRMPALVHQLFLKGVAAWEAAVPVLAEEIRKERAAVDAQDAVDAVDLSPRETEDLVGRMQEYEGDTEPLYRATVIDYLARVNNLDVERLRRADRSVQVRWHAHANVLLREDRYLEIAPLLLQPLEADRVEARRHPDHQFLRLGHPLLDKLRGFAEVDDRGRAFVMWRHEPQYRGPPVLIFRLDYVVEADGDILARALEEMQLPGDRRAEAERLADSFFPPRFEAFFLDEGVQLVGPGDPRRAWLERSYSKRAGDRSLAREKLAAIPSEIGLARWAAACAAVRAGAAALIPSDPGHQRACREAEAQVLEYFARRIDQVRLVNRDGPADVLRALVAAEETLRDAMQAAVRQPAVRLDAAGVIVLAGRPCPFPDEEGDRDA